MKVVWTSLAIIAALFVGLPSYGQSTNEKPTIAIISVPTDSPGENMASEHIKGTAAMGNEKGAKVVVYALGGDTWWVQPYETSPYTDIGDDSKWESQTHGGTKFLALLVKPTYKPQGKLSTIPATGGDVLAVAKWPPEKK